MVRIPVAVSIICMKRWVAWVRLAMSVLNVRARAFMAACSAWLWLAPSAVTAIHWREGYSRSRLVTHAGAVGAAVVVGAVLHERMRNEEGRIRNVKRIRLI